MIPEPITIDGRKGTVVYLDAQWHPVTPEQATMARVLFDDGGTAFYTTEESTQKFDESKHPRNEDGEFTKQLQGDEEEAAEEARTFFHGTTEVRLPDILKQGLLTGHAGEVWPSFSQRDSVYMTVSEDDAQEWAEKTAERAAFGHAEKKPHVAILTIRIPDEYLQVLTRDTHFGNIDQNPARQFKGNIPPSWIIGAKVGYPSDDPWEDVTWKDVPLKKAAADGQIIYVAIVLQSSAEKQPGLGGITRKFDESKHPRGKDGRFAEATQPRIFNRLSDVEQYESWGREKKWQWRKETPKSGFLLTGEPIPREQLPEVLYHVTTNAPAVESSGVLLGLQEGGGLGGGQAEGVSFTSSKEDADVILRELKRSVLIARGEVDIDVFERWAREDEQTAGLPKGTLDHAVEFSHSSWDVDAPNMGKTHYWDKDAPEGERYKEGPPASSEEKERVRRSLLKDALNAYLIARDTVSREKNAPSLKNPILFGRQEHLGKLDPEGIQILEVESARIPLEALVTTGSDTFLHEVRAYSDVPYRRRKKVAFEEEKHPRHPEGSSEGGRFAETGRAGTPTPDPVLAAQAKAGIGAVEKLLPEAVQQANFSNVPGAWEDLNEAAREKVRKHYEDETYDYTSTHLDTYDLDSMVMKEVETNKKAEILEKAAKRVAEDYKDVLDPTTIEPDPKHLDWIGEVPLNWDKLRHMDGTPVPYAERKDIQQDWHEHYSDVWKKAVEEYQDSDEYLARREQLVLQKVSESWKSLTDSRKVELATEMRLVGELSGDVLRLQREPKQWVTGVETGTHGEDNYARTHAIALKLTELRTDQLRAERGLLEQQTKPTYTIEKPDFFNEKHPQYLIKNAAGIAVGSSNTIEQATHNAEEWADRESKKPNLTSSEVISTVWESWKRKSSEGLGLSLQLAAARELGGHHRMTPDEVREAEAEAVQQLGNNGMATLQAYVRAQWETTQMVMAKAGQDKVSVYRGLMLAGDRVKGTTNVRLGNDGKPIAPPKNIEERIDKQSGAPVVSFDYDEKHFVVGKVKQPAKSILEIEPQYWHQINPEIQGKVYKLWQEDAAEAAEGKLPEEKVKKLFEHLGDESRFRLMLDYIDKGRLHTQTVPQRPYEDNDSAIQRRIDAYHDSTQAGGLVRLPELQLKRAGAQSTTGTQSVANNWGGVGDNPPDARRVVIRIEAPSTSVLSLPVYGQNMAEEHESVIMGTKDKWLWDAWRDRAPDFDYYPVTGQPHPRPLIEWPEPIDYDSKMALKNEPLVIDLQAEDRGKPHWLSSVDWSMNKYSHILKYDPNQPRGPKGSSTGGRWVKGQGLADIAPGYREFPSKPDDPGVAQARQQMGYTSVAPGMERNAGNASYAAIMNAPTGTGFKNPPRGEEVAATLAQIEAVAAAEAKAKSTGGSVKTALSTGSVDEVKKKFDGGVNTSILVEMSDPNHTRAVFKPEVGELWGHGFTNSDIDQYITNKDFSLAEREAMASEVSDALGFTLVPETVHRTSLEGVDPSEYGGDGGSGYDSYELREMYDDYREKAQEKAQDEVSEEMGKLFAEAQQEHVDDIGNRAEEMTDIWNQVVKDYPDSPYGDPEAQREHPALPLGSKPPFERRTEKDVLDPMEVLDEANVDVTASMNDEEKKRVEDVFRKKLDEGYQELGDVDEDRAREHLQWDDWLPLHENTEAKLLDERVKTFESWKETFGYRDNASDGPQNQDAPHPNGGSLQRFVPHLRGYGDMSHEDATRMAVLDYVIGSMDRHGNNLMFDGDQPVAIDNGYSMPGSDQPDNFQFRSVAVSEWLSDARHKKVPEPLRQSILNEIDKTNWQSLVDRHPNMSREEREAFLGRVANMKEALSYDEGLSTLWHDQQLMRY